MKKLFKTPFLLSTILCALAFHCIAQKPTFNWGEEQKKSDDYFLGYHDGNYYSLEVNENGLLLYKYGNNNELINKHQFNEKEKIFTGNSMFLNNSIYCFFYSYDKKTNTITYFKKSIDTDLNNESEYEVFDEINASRKIRLINFYGYKEKQADNLNIYNLNNGDNIFNFWLFKSENETKELSLVRDETNKKSKNESIRLALYDQKLSKVWDKKIEFPYKDKDFEITKLAIDNSGLVFGIGKIQLNDNTKGAPDSKFIMFSYDNNSDSYSEYEVSLDDINIYDVSFFLDNKKGTILLTGLCHDFMNEIYGTFNKSFTIASKAMSKEKMKIFDPGFLTTNLYGFIIREVYKRDNGGYCMIAEEDYLVHNTDAYIANMFHSKNIILVNMSNSGNIDLVTSIPKNQASFSDHGDYLSFSYLDLNNKQYFVFYDNVRNIENLKSNNIKKRIDLMEFNNSKLEKSVLVLATVNEKGEVNKEVITTGFTLMKNKIYYKPKQYFKAGNKLFVISSFEKLVKFGFFNIE